MSITRNEKRYDEATRTYTTVSSRTEYEGRVIRVFQRDYRAMSDVYTLATFATVMELDGSFNDVLVDANFECDVSGDHAEVDATEECTAMWMRLLKRQREHEQQAREEDVRRYEERLCNTPRLGKRMEVVRGRKVPIGTKGTVAYIPKGGYGNVLLKDDSCWTDRSAPGIWVNPSYLKARF